MCCITRQNHLFYTNMLHDYNVMICFMILHMKCYITFEMLYNPSQRSLDARFFLASEALLQRPKSERALSRVMVALLA